MIYVFDTSAFSDMFKSMYRSVFETMWERFDALVEEERVTSTREVRREIEDRYIEALHNWVENNKDVFTTPTAAEGAFVGQIYSVPHFQQNIEQKKLLKGGKNADPFLIAKAAVIGGTVVTMETEPPNAARVPNICRHFGVPCMTLEEFMEAEGWRF